MSNITSFPDAIVFPDGTIRLVTAAAKSWAYRNTQVNDKCTASSVPDYVDFVADVPDMMKQKGFVLKHERQPVFHYRSKRRRRPKAKTPKQTKLAFDRHRARFKGMTLAEYRKRTRTRRAPASPRPGRKRAAKGVARKTGAKSKNE